MHAITPERWSMSSFGATYSSSGPGGGPSTWSHGPTALTLSQKGWKSTTRSLMTCMLPAGSTTMGPPFLATSEILVLQASMAWPFMRMAHDPQMALRHEQRRARVPSMSSRILIRPSRTTAPSSMSSV